MFSDKHALTKAEEVPPETVTDGFPRYKYHKDLSDEKPKTDMQESFFMGGMDPLQRDHGPSDVHVDADVLVCSSDDLQIAKPRYRPDIDGLRAIAVAFVLAYSYFPTRFAGGVVGVDMFLVTAGFTIASVSLPNNQSLNILEFICNRAVRLLPSFILTAVVVTLAGIFLLPQPSFETMGSSLAWACGFSVNVRFVVKGSSTDNGNGGDYWQATAANTDYVETANPFLHLWIISVLVQFYCVWVLCLLAFRHLRTSFSQGLVLGTVLFLSFATNLGFGVADMFMAQYYLVATRLWEPFMGALIVWAPWQWVKSLNHSAFMLEALSIAGTALIVISIGITSAEDKLPDSRALFSVLGTTLIILGGEKSMVNSYTLGNTIFRFVGKTSYPIFMWHWPILVFCRIVVMKPTQEIPDPKRPFCSDLSNNDELFTWWLRLLLVGASLMVGIATHYWLEKPIRKRCNLKLIHKFMLLAMVLLFMVGALIGIGDVSVADRSTNKGSDESIPPYVPTNSSQSLAPFHMLVDCVANISPERVRKTYPILGAESHRFSFEGKRAGHVVFLGDSHMDNFQSRIEYLYGENGRAEELPDTTVFFKHGTPPLPSSISDMVVNFNHKYTTFDYLELSKEVEDFVDNPANGVTAVVLLGFWEVYLHSLLSANGAPFEWPRTLDELESLSTMPTSMVQFLNKWTTYIEGIVSSGKSIYVVKPYMTHYDLTCPGTRSPYLPPFYSNGAIQGCPDCLPSQMLEGGSKTSDRLVPKHELWKLSLPLSKSHYYNTTSFIVDPLLSAAVSAGATLIDPTTTLCKGDLCPVLDPTGRPAYKDWDHLRPEFAVAYGSFLDEVYGQTPSLPSEYCNP